jgi:RHS repeat-associated protein
LYRLTGENIANDPANNGNIGYIYDPVGNRNQRTSSITPISTQNFTGGYNPADLLKPTFSFDQNGNQTSDSQGRTYSYNTLNQLTEVTGTGVNLNYLYDGDGLRTQKTNNTTGVTTSYLWDRNNLTGYPQVTEEFQNGQLTRRYVYGPEGPLYMVQLVNGTWVTSYYGKDAQNVRFLMNDSGQITDSYTWDAFGNLISSSGIGTANNIGFDGEYADNDTGLVYLRARWMNPTIGRFITSDSFEGVETDPSSLNHYTGFSNDPVNRIDPEGNFDISSSIGSAIEGILASFPRVTGFVERLLGRQVEVEKDYFFPEFQKGYAKNKSGQLVKVVQGGVNVGIGARYRFRDPVYPEYRWVQLVTSSIPVSGISAGTQFYDGETPSVSPQYYYDNAKEQKFKGVGGYDSLFTDEPNATVGSNQSFQLNFDFHAKLVGVNPTGSLSFTPLFDIHYYYKFTNTGVTVPPAPDITRLF